MSRSVSNFNICSMFINRVIVDVGYCYLLEYVHSLLAEIGGLG